MICRDTAFQPQVKKQKKENNKKDRFSFSDFGDELIKEFHIQTITGGIYYQKDGYYKQDYNTIENIILVRVKDIPMVKRNEILNYIRVRTTIKTKDIKRDPYIINVQNTRMYVKTGELLDFTPEVIDFDRIPVTYDKNARCEELDLMLQRIFSGDAAVIDLLEEM